MPLTGEKHQGYLHMPMLKCWIILGKNQQDETFCFHAKSKCIQTLRQAACHVQYTMHNADTSCAPASWKPESPSLQAIRGFALPSSISSTKLAHLRTFNGFEKFGAFERNHVGLFLSAGLNWRHMFSIGYSPQFGIGLGYLHTWEHDGRTYLAQAIIKLLGI